MHLQVRIAAQAIDGDERRTVARGEPLLGAAVAAHLPRRADQLRELLGGRTATQGTPQIGAVRAVETQVSQPIRCQPAAIAGVAERLGRRRDDAEDRAVRQAEAIRRRR